EFLQIDIAAVLARLDGADDAVRGGRCHAHYPEEGFERNARAPRQFGCHSRAVERNVQQPPVREVFRDGASERADQVPTPVLPGLEIENSYFEGIAGLGTLHIDRAGQDMAARPLPTFGMDLALFRQHL